MQRMNFRIKTELDVIRALHEGKTNLLKSLALNLAMFWKVPDFFINTLKNKENNKYALEIFSFSKSALTAQIWGGQVFLPNCQLLERSTSFLFFFFF